MFVHNMDVGKKQDLAEPSSSNLLIKHQTLYPLQLFSTRKWTCAAACTPNCPFNWTFLSLHEQQEGTDICWGLKKGKVSLVGERDWQRSQAELKSPALCSWALHFSVELHQIIFYRARDRKTQTFLNPDMVIIQATTVPRLASHLTKL